MNILGKYLLNSAVEKKGRFILLVLSIAVSTALLIGCLHSIDILVDIFESQAKGSYGDFNVVIASKNQQKNNLIDMNDIEYLDDETMIRRIEMPGYVSDEEEIQVMVSGMDIAEMKNWSTMSLIEERGIEPFLEKEILLSEQTAENLKLSIGEEIKLTLLGKEESFQIVGIYEKKGLFQYDGESYFHAIVPKDDILELYNIKEQYSTILVKVDLDKADQWVEEFNDQNQDVKYTAKKTYDEQSIVQQLSWIQGPLYFMLIIVFIMAVFIIYSSFKLTINEKLSTIGTFLSQGATFRQVYLLLLGESVIYGILGGLCGFVLGALAISTIKFYTGVSDTFLFFQDVNGFYCAVGFLFAVFFSIISALLPILSIRKQNTKDIILNKISVKYKSSTVAFIIGAVLVILSLLINTLEEMINYVASMPVIFVFISGMILCIPKLIYFMTMPFKKLLKNISIVPVLAMNNVVSSKAINNNIVLLTISIMSMIIISSIGTSIVDVINDSYALMNFDYTIRTTFLNNEELYDRVFELEEDRNIHTTGSIESYLNGDLSKTLSIYYVDPIKQKDYEEYMTYSDKNSQLDELNTNKAGIILCKRIADSNGLKPGDQIEVEVDDKSYSLKVLSITDPRMFAGGNYNMISLETAESLFNVTYPQQYNLTTNLSKEDIKSDLNGMGVEVRSKAEVVEEEQLNMKQFVDILFLFSIMTMVVGSFGIISNVSIAYLQRKKDLAVMVSVGLNNFNKKLMIVYESILQAIFGSLFGIMGGYVAIVLIKSIFIFLTLDLDLVFPFDLVGIIFFLSILLMLLASISSVNRSNKLDVVSELKEE